MVSVLGFVVSVLGFVISALGWSEGAIWAGGFAIRVPGFVKIIRTLILQNHVFLQKPRNLSFELQKIPEPQHWRPEKRFFFVEPQTPKKKRGFGVRQNKTRVRSVWFGLQVFCAGLQVFCARVHISFVYWTRFYEVSVKK